MVTHFSEKQLGFSNAVREIAREVMQRPETRRLHSSFILALVDSFLEYDKTKRLSPQ